MIVQYVTPSHGKSMASIEAIRVARHNARSRAKITLASIPSLDATPERIQRAKDLGLSVVHAEIRDASGFDTGQRRRELLGVLETLASRKCINDVQLHAGAHFLRLWATAARGPRITHRWDDTPRGDGSADSDYIAQALQNFRQSWISVHHRCAPVLSWLVDTQLAEITPSVADLGLRYQGASGTEAARARGMTWLCFALDELAAHYGLISRITANQRRRELEELLRRK